MNADDRMRELGYDLPTKVNKRGGVVPCVLDGTTLYVSGHGPEDNEGNLLFKGRVGSDLSVEDGYAAARATGVQLLRSVHDHLGSLERVERVIKVFGLVNSALDFYDQPAVIHGCSDLLIEVFGERGKHARSAMGTSVLPLNQPVEIEMIVKVRDR
ncbi:MAG: RidA family protein [Actinobacteria bacterium]|nr:RidA family protein [Actinomycetota bacterium]